MILHLGVIDQNYSYDQQVGRRKTRRVTKSVSTGDVAEFLENKYHLFEVFYEIHQADIAADLEEGLAGTLESLLMGASPDLSAFGSAESNIDERFRKFLDAGEMEALGYPGVPTEASGRGKRVGGINHRLRHPYARSNPARPSFIDTGLLQASFKSWVD